MEMGKPAGVLRADAQSFDVTHRGYSTDDHRLALGSTLGKQLQLSHNR
jgi:hypothetical protein